MTVLEQKVALIEEKCCEVFELNLKLQEKIKQDKDFEFDKSQHFKNHIADLESQIADLSKVDHKKEIISMTDKISLK